MDAEEPDVEGRDREQQRQLDDGRVQPAQHAAARLTRRFGDQRLAVAQGEQRRTLVELRRAAVGQREHPQRTQLLLDEELDVLAAHPLAVRLGDGVRDRLGVALPVARLGDEVEQPGELDDLAVGAASEMRGRP